MTNSIFDSNQKDKIKEMADELIKWDNDNMVDYKKISNYMEIFLNKNLEIEKYVLSIDSSKNTLFYDIQDCKKKFII